MAIPYKKGRFDIDRDTPDSVIRSKLEEARRLGGIYLIANLIRVAKEHGISEELRTSERKRLLEAIEQARFSKETPLKSWIPRGYQIARLLATAKALIPDFDPAVSNRDKALMNEALAQFRREKDIWGKDQVPSLLYAAKSLGVELC